jgi:hypothetical protein
MVSDCALDSSTTIPAVRGDPVVARNINRALAAGCLILVPPHASYEVMRGVEERGAVKQLRMFNELLDTCPLGMSTKEMLDAASHVYNELRRAGEARETAAG